MNFLIRSTNASDLITGLDDVICACCIQRDEVCALRWDIRGAWSDSWWRIPNCSSIPDRLQNNILTALRTSQSLVLPKHSGNTWKDQGLHSHARICPWDTWLNEKCIAGSPAPWSKASNATFPDRTMTMQYEYNLSKRFKRKPRTSIYHVQTTTLCCLKAGWTWFKIDSSNRSSYLVA